MEDVKKRVEGRRRWFSWKRALLALGLLLVMLMGGILSLIFVGDVDVPRVVVTARRDASGEMVSDLKWGLQPGFTCTKLSANMDASSSLDGSWGKDRTVFTRSIAVFAEGDSAMERSVAYALFKELQKGKRFEQVIFYPAGSRPTDGGAQPDLTARVRMWKLDTSGIRMLDEQINASVVVMLEANGAIGRAFYVDSLTPPVASLNYASMVQCSAVQKGIESAGKRYETVARNIAETAASGIEKTLVGATRGAPKLDVIQPEFMPGYTATPDFAFLKAFDAKPLLSGPVFMRSNFSTWDVAYITPGRDIVAEAEAELRGKGWVIDESGGSGISRRLRVRTSDGSEVVEIQQARTEDTLILGGMPVEPRRVVSYERRMSQKEISAALKAWLAQNPSENELLLFKRQWHFEQKIFEAHFAKIGLRTVDGALHMAQGAAERKENDVARKWLLTADALARIASPKAQTPYDVKMLGKTIGLKTFAEVPDLSGVDERMRVDLAKGLPAKRLVPLGTSLIVVHKESPTELEVQSITPVVGDKPGLPYVFEVKTVKFSKGGHSTSGESKGDPTGKGGPIGFLDPAGKPLVLESRQVGTDEVFEVTVKK